MNCQLSVKKDKGFTLVDVLVGTALLLIVFLGLFAAFQLGLRVTGQSKNKIIATYIANGQLEQIRNLPYESIGVQDSFPGGVLLPESEVVQNNVVFKIERRVDYVIDPADGIASSQDECPNDYKRAEVKVSSGGKFPIQISMATDIAPKNLAQECLDTGGILSVAVFDASGLMVPSPFIEIEDPASGAILKTATPIDGKHYFSLEPGTYKVVVSRLGFSSERTYGTDEIAIPINPHPIILEDQLTETSFSIDRLSSFAVNTLSRLEEDVFPVANVTLNLRGTKIIGHDEQENPVYKYSQDYTSNAQGYVEIEGLEWDNYIFTIVSPQELNLIETDPGPQPIGLPPQNSMNVQLFLSSENSLLVIVQNIETLEPVFSAEARLYNASLGYDVVQYTNEKGQTYFIPLGVAIYNLEVQAPGYNSTSTTVYVSGDATKTIKLEQVE